MKIVNLNIWYSNNEGYYANLQLEDGNYLSSNKFILLSDLMKYVSEIVNKLDN